MVSATTISLPKETKEMLRKMGSTGQTYDEVIRELIKRASIKELDARWNRILEEDSFRPRPKADTRVIEGTDPKKYRIRIGDYRAINAVVQREV